MKRIMAYIRRNMEPVVLGMILGIITVILVFIFATAMYNLWKHL